ncbi:PH domain-containing protein [Streptomyces sp. NPDC048717]|uniref:PH domain-containing protein n=1 Tax=Streptomyces sp. NPDC048717 TaxID=3154928 RepID=UPI00342E1FBE
MPDVWIVFSPADRRRYWWRTGVVVTLLVGVTVAMGLAEIGSDPWWWVGVFGILYLVAIFDMVNRIYGRTLLTAAGMELRTLVSRRRVPWSEIAGVEERRRTTRSGTWTHLRITRHRGRPLALPGTLTNRIWDAELDRKQVAIQEYRSRATTVGPPNTQAAG